MAQALEIVIYKLKSNASEKAFLAASAEMEQKFARKQKGFVSRLFGKSDAGDWVDVVTWETMQDALQASESAMASPICAPMFGMLDETSVKMHHFTKV